jgi:hypothetical protein
MMFFFNTFSDADARAQKDVSRLCTKEYGLTIKDSKELGANLPRGSRGSISFIDIYYLIKHIRICFENSDADLDALNKQQWDHILGFLNFFIRETASDLTSLIWHD